MEYIVILNGKELSVENSTLSYEEVASLADKKNEILTVTYAGAIGPKEFGILHRGEQVTVENGTRLNAYFTGNA